MSKGHSRRENDLENYEAEFLEALDRARKEEVSAYIADKQGRKRGAATALDVQLFTLESKIIRMREKLGMPAFEVPLTKIEVPRDPEAGWPSPPSYEETRFGLDLARFHNELAQSGRDPEALFFKVKYAGAKHRQGADQPTWRLAMIEVGDDRSPAKLTLTIYPLPRNADTEPAAHKLEDALNRIVHWSEKVAETPPAERPRLMHVTYTRASRELAFHAR